MTEGALSQEEVDALLADVEFDSPTEDAATTLPPTSEGGAAAPGTSGPFDFARNERLARQPIAPLAGVGDRFARALADRLFGLVRRMATVKALPPRLCPFGEFTSALETPAHFNVVAMRPLRGQGLVVFEPSLVFLVIDAMFGGNGRLVQRPGNAGFTGTEQRIIQRLRDGVLESYGKAWEPVLPLQCEHLRGEDNGQYASIARDAEPVVASSFEVALGAARGALHVCMPYSMLAPVRSADGAAQAGSTNDLRWTGSLSREVQHATVTLVARLADAQLSVGEVVRMRPGDVIPIDIAEEVVAGVDGIPMFACEVGQSRNRYAIKVRRTLATPGVPRQGGNDGQGTR